MNKFKMDEHDEDVMGDNEPDNNRKRESIEGIRIPTIKVDFTPDSSSSMTTTWSSMTISLPPTGSTSSSQMNLLLSSNITSRDMRLSISEPVLIEKEGKLVFQSDNKR